MRTLGLALVVISGAALFCLLVAAFMVGRDAQLALIYFGCPAFLVFAAGAAIVLSTAPRSS